MCNLYDQGELDLCQKGPPQQHCEMVVSIALVIILYSLGNVTQLSYSVLCHKLEAKVCRVLA